MEKNGKQQKNGGTPLQLQRFLSTQITVLWYHPNRIVDALSCHYDFAAFTP